MKETTWRIYDRKELNPEYQAFKLELPEGSPKPAFPGDDEKPGFMVTNFSGIAGWEMGSENRISKNVLGGLDGTVYIGLSCSGRNKAVKIAQAEISNRYSTIVKKLNDELLK